MCSSSFALSLSVVCCVSRLKSKFSRTASLDSLIIFPSFFYSPRLAHLKFKRGFCSYLRITDRPCRRTSEPQAYFFLFLDATGGLRHHTGLNPWCSWENIRKFPFVINEPVHFIHHQIQIWIKSNSNINKREKMSLGPWTKLRSQEFRTHWSGQLRLSLVGL